MIAALTHLDLWDAALLSAGVLVGAIWSGVRIYMPTRDREDGRRR